MDVFSRKAYRDIFIDSLRFCQENKGLELYAYCIMSNHVHLIIGSEKMPLTDLMRDLKIYFLQDTQSHCRKPGGKQKGMDALDV